MIIIIHFNRVTGTASVAGAAAEPIASEKDEPEICREVYERLIYGGTPHLPPEGETGDE